MIRYYDNNGLLSFIPKDENGYRLFSKDDLSWLEFIFCMRSTDMPFETLCHIAELYMQGSEALEKRKEIFNDHKLGLLNKKEDIDKALELLDKESNKLYRFRY